MADTNHRAETRRRRRERTLHRPAPSDHSRRDLLALGSPSFLKSYRPPDPLAMRRDGRGPISNLGAPTTAPLGVIDLTRMGFGLRPGALDEWNALGADDDARHTAYVNQQLDPASIVDTDVENRITAAGFTTLGKSLTQLWTDHHVNPPDYSTRVLPVGETRAATFLRAVYSRRQLFEVLVDFWHNHFNVFAWDYRSAPVWVHTDRDVIRAHALGNFRTLLEEVGRSTAMLYYLDNYTSSDGGPNENYARELFELHALGAENYLGVMRQNEVPTDAGGLPVGYVDDDVYETTRCFTGWTVDDGVDVNDGEFYYRADWHDRFQKNVLGLFIPADQADMRDGMDVYDRLAELPGTGRYIAGKLCRRLISDNPPQSIIDAAAAVFTAQKDASDQLEQVVRTILLSEEYKTTWGEKIRRPFEVVAGMLRSTDADISMNLSEGVTGTFFWRFDQAGQPLFSWPAPNGYPDARAAWIGSVPRVMAWKTLAWLSDARNEADTAYLIDALGQTPPDVRSANAIVDFWVDRILGRAMPTAEREELVVFMAQGFNPDLDLPVDTDEDTQERLHALLALICMSPEFTWR